MEQMNLLTEMYADLRAIRAEQNEFKREVLYRLDTLEKEARKAPGVRRAAALAFLSTAAGVFSCVSRFFPARS